MKKRHVYIFRGAPASGKGSIVPKICGYLPKPVALIEEDMFLWDLHLIGRSIPEIGEEEHAFAYRNMVMIFEQYLKADRYTIVLEGLFTWEDGQSSRGSIHELVVLAERYGYAWSSIVLKAEKEELLKRNAARSYSVPLAEFETLYDDVYRKIDSKELVIDSTGKSIDDTVQVIRTELSLD